MIPTEDIVRTVAGRGITGSIETVWVAARFREELQAGVQTYEQGRRAFEGGKRGILCGATKSTDGHLQ
jgi:hypothetical protein